MLSTSQRLRTLHLAVIDIGGYRLTHFWQAKSKRMELNSHVIRSHRIHRSLSSVLPFSANLHICTHVRPRRDKTKWKANNKLEQHFRSNIRSGNKSAVIPHTNLLNAFHTQIQSALEAAKRKSNHRTGFHFRSDLFD
ncbi:uncharacterized protein LOC129731741 [Wyeomyia smithii]|uniref:uncharacterized protein LOC129731741 n=1 Tax=Wyeomyia smithii TaxID=174621 RepID=UPI0024681641|nr:uncharacterized protein LOC129731741 [Wyeomyia smithii]